MLFDWDHPLGLGSPSMGPQRAFHGRENFIYQENFSVKYPFKLKIVTSSSGIQFEVFKRYFVDMKIKIYNN